MAGKIRDKICFVIAPIGREGSETRLRSDQVLKDIIEPVAKDLSYEVIRADKMPEPGIVTVQIIQHLVDAALVIADLTEGNPNVYYELAIRHVTGKPFVQMIEDGEDIRFNLASTRVIVFRHGDPESVGDCRDRLRKQIQLMEHDPSHVDNPISVAVDLKALKLSGSFGRRSLGDVLEAILRLGAEIGYLGNSLNEIKRELLMSKLIGGLRQSPVNKAFSERQREIG